MLELGPTVDYDVELGSAAQVVGDAWTRGWEIPPRLTISEWADKHRQIGKGAGAEPGQWHTSRNPPLREIMDALSDHSPVRLVDFMKSAQIGATEVGINWVGYVIDRGIDSMIVAQPVKDLARSWSVSKFEPALAMMPALQARITVDNTFEKRFSGGTLSVLWTNSSSQLRQRTARFIFMDEVDEYSDNLGDQGSADEQLAARALSYGGRGKAYRACTPTVEGASKIEKGFLDGDQRYYQLPCPHCGHHSDLKLKHLQPHGVFVCPGCGSEVDGHHKTAMLQERSACAGCGAVPVRMIHEPGTGADNHVYEDVCACGTVVDPPAPDGAYWKPTNPKADPLHRSYHLWAAYTPVGLGLIWPDIATRRARADEDPSKKVSFDNLVCGKTHAGERREQNADEIQKLAEPGVRLGVVPKGGLILLAGIDCQHDRFEVQVIAKGRGQRTRVIDYAVIEGNPSRPDGYSALDEYLKGTWRNSHGVDMHITALAIDGGNWTEMVAQFVKGLVLHSGNHRVFNVGDRFCRQWIYLVRGRSEKKSDRAVYRPKKTEVNHRDKTVARSVGVWGVGTSVLKHLIYGWLSSALAAKTKAEEQGEAENIESRMLRFPGGRGEDYDPLTPDPGALTPTYYKGLTCEYFDIAASQWVKPRGMANEQLDTLIYAEWVALAPAIKVDVKRESEWAALEAALEPETDLFSMVAANRPVDSRGTKSVDVGTGQRATQIDASDEWSDRL